jgi:D-alanyl-D-alanine carboxypeptidase
MQRSRTALVHQPRIRTILEKGADRSRATSPNGSMRPPRQYEWDLRRYDPTILTSRVFIRARPLVVAVLAVAVLSAQAGPGTAGENDSNASSADQALDRALTKFVNAKGAAPGIAVVVQRGDAEEALHTAGVTDLATDAVTGLDDHMRLASVAKAFSGAVALSVVAEGKLALTDTLAERVAGMPVAWADVTLAQLLHHTSGIPDFSTSDAFSEALTASLLVAPPPTALLSYVADQPLLFEPGSKYRYSNSDNIAVGLMVESATGRTYEQELQDRVYQPLALTNTSLPRDAALPTPFIHGYDVSERVPEDVSETFAAGWTWASGGIVASPADANRFVRAYASGATTNASTKADQFDFVEGHSEPPGPGKNSAGLAIFRYKTKCGTVYGHTGNTPGYTQFIAATDDGSRSATVGINAQITPKNDKARFGQLRRIFGLAVCAALADS